MHSPLCKSNPEGLLLTLDSQLHLWFGSDNTSSAREGIGHVVMIHAVDRDDAGSTLVSGGRFLSTLMYD